MDDQLLPLRRATYRDIQFDGDTLLAVIIEGDGVAVPIRTVCDILGLDLDAQSAQLRQHDVLAQGLRVVNVPISGRVRSTMAIVHTWIPFWLASISPQQVLDTVRPKLIRYQTEVAYVLAALYGNDISPAPMGSDPVITALQQQLAQALREARLAREAYLASQQQIAHLQAAQQEAATRLESHETQISEHRDLLDTLSGVITISAAQQQIVKDGILRIATRYKQQHGTDLFARLFAEFCNDLRTPRYSALPANRYEAALAWIRQKAAEYLPDDPDAFLPKQESLI